MKTLLVFLKHNLTFSYPGKSTPRAATSLLISIAVVAFLNCSAAFMRAGWLLREWISRIGERPDICLSNSAAKETWRAVGKKTMHFEVDFPDDMWSWRSFLSTSIVVCIKFVCGVIMYDCSTKKRQLKTRSRKRYRWKYHAHVCSLRLLIMSIQSGIPDEVLLQQPLKRIIRYKKCSLIGLFKSTFLISLLTVAENKRACLVCLGGKKSNIASSSRRNPWSRRRSASSYTMVLRPANFALSGVVFRWSRSLPGVAMRMSQGDSFRRLPSVVWLWKH